MSFVNVQRPLRPPAAPAQPVPAVAPVQRVDGGSQIPIFVINLARDAARMRTIDGHLQALGLRYERINGFDGPALYPRVRRLRQRDFFSPRLNRIMTPGEVGCTLSHVRALRAVVTRRLPYAIILEDDVAFTSGFAALVRDELAGLHEHAHVIKLEGIRDHRSSRSGVRLAMANVGDLFVPLRPALGSAGYAVNATGARLLFKAFKQIDRPLDHRLAAYDQHGAIYAEFSRFPAYQIRGHSNIKAERQQAVVQRHSLVSYLQGRGRIVSTAWRRAFCLGLLLLRRKPQEKVRTAG